MPMALPGRQRSAQVTAAVACLLLAVAGAQPGFPGPGGGGPGSRGPGGTGCPSPSLHSVAALLPAYSHIPHRSSAGVVWHCIVQASLRAASQQVTGQAALEVEGLEGGDPGGPAAAVVVRRYVHAHLHHSAQSSPGICRGCGVRQGCAAFHVFITGWTRG